MADCCEDKSCALEQLRGRQSRTLKTVLGINTVMFVVVLAAGLYASSTALLADSLDNLGDALTYALSLYAVGRGQRAKGMVSLFKAALILGALVAAAAVWLVGAGWPDLVIGALLALLLLRSASRVFRASVAAVRASPQPS